MNKLKTFRDLVIWQKSIQLSIETYRVSKLLPREESFGLIDQMRRASISIPSNIAEGFGRNSNNDFKRFLKIALGSVFELQTQLLIAKELNYINSETFDLLNNNSKEIDRMIYAFIKYLEKNVVK